MVLGVAAMLHAPPVPFAEGVVAPVPIVGFEDVDQIFAARSKGSSKFCDVGTKTAARG